MNRLGRVFILSAVSLAAAVSHPPQQVPPANIPIEQTPMFISLGFDDNSHSGMPEGTESTGGIKWVCDFTENLVNPPGTGQAETFDGVPVRTTFFSNSFYFTPSQGDFASLVKWAHNHAYLLGHEIANHTHSHLSGGPTLSQAGWEAEITLANEWFTKPAPDSITIAVNNAWGAGVAPQDIVGFRAPYLFYGNNLFKALRNLGFRYDSSIEEGFDPAQDGTNFYWPYTMDHPSPGHDYMVDVSETKEAGYYVPEHPGLWQLPVYALIVPPDDKCEEYGITTGFRDRLAAHVAGLRKPGVFSASNGKISGLDYNLFYFQEFNLSKDETLAILKYTLDQRMAGNRAPMLIGLHSQFYTNFWSVNTTGIPDPLDRQAVVEEFVDYALTKYEDVRIVPMRDVVTWMENPVPLNNTTSVKKPLASATVAPSSLEITRGTLRMQSTTQQTLRLFSVNGALVFSQVSQPQNGFCVWDLNSAVPVGTYIARVENQAIRLHISE
ncbi:chitin deacetylase [Chitinispirillum alkaliphilum]|nr:chitin deacetylase [Chitinispirillum alkaliphilum]